MANHKRKTPKLHIYVLCCKGEALFMTGNHPGRKPPRDLRQPQMNEDKGNDPEFEQWLSYEEFLQSYEDNYDEGW